MKYNCPSCGADVPFKSRFSVMSVCEYCESIIVRHDMNLEELGKASSIAEDMSPLQLGTKGSFDGDKFEIIGRQKAVYDNGYWNEWYVLFEDGQDGWLAEAQGFYMISFEKKEKIELPKLDGLKVNKDIKIDNINYTIFDIKEVTYKGCEGELPQKNLVGTKATSIDLSGLGNRFCNIVTTPHGGRFVYIGSYLEFEEFHFTSLRSIEGW